MMIANERTRSEIAARNQYREFNKQQAVENPRWMCSCGVMNFARTWMGELIMTPRVYNCHNSKCDRRRFYFRDGDELHAREVLASEVVDETGFESDADPVKFYAFKDRLENLIWIKR